MAFDKDKYWENRKAGKNGTGEIPKPKPVVQENPAERGFDNEGNIIIKNRAFRRKPVKLPGDNLFTKKTITKSQRKKLRKLGRR